MLLQMALTTNSMMTFGLLHSSLMKTARAQVSVQEEAMYTAQCREYAVRCGCPEPLHCSSGAMQALHAGIAMSGAGVMEPYFIAAGGIAHSAWSLAVNRGCALTVPSVFEHRSYS